MMISIYLVIAIICAILLAVMAAFADFGGDMDMDVDVDVDIDIDGVDGGYGDFQGAGISPLSGPIVLVFGTIFGGAGTIFEWMDLPFMLVPVLAVIVGVALTGVIFVMLVKVFVKTQATTQVKLSSLIGKDAETTMPIQPEESGQIMVLTEERGRTLLTATADVEISSNTVVTIIGLEGGGVKVEPKRRPRKRKAAPKKKDDTDGPKDEETKEDKEEQ